jgi:hypothetical protein
VEELVIARESQGRHLVEIREGGARVIDAVQGEKHAVLLVVIEGSVASDRTIGGECLSIEAQTAMLCRVAGTVPSMDDIVGVQHGPALLSLADGGRSGTRVPSRCDGFNSKPVRSHVKGLYSLP